MVKVDGNIWSDVLQEHNNTVERHGNNVYKAVVKRAFKMFVVAPNRQQTKSISLLVSAYFDGFTTNCCILTVYIDS